MDVTLRWNFSSDLRSMSRSMVNKALTTPPVNKALTDPIWPSPRLIRAGRTLAGANQAALAHKAGVTRQAISVVEKDKSHKMDPRRRKILEAMQRVLENDYGI